ncbi:MAG TPA: glycoside hydrolase family 76 protein [Motilibacterales bacterium]|nr:glycoside hydrolase family 76 protein [Motilibacterales bacterium]
MTWQERARDAHSVLADQYWVEPTGLFRVDTSWRGCVTALIPWGAWHYWWQAHALEVLLDAHEAGDDGAGQRAVRLLQASTRRSHRDLTANPYYDDLAWMGLATLRAHSLGLVGMRTPRALADAVAAGWDSALGGVRWRVGDEFRNVAATAPSAMLLAGVSQMDGDARRLVIGRVAADWLHATVVDPCGIVWDGCRPRGGVLVPEGRLWSYNVGTVAGLDVVLAGLSDADEARRLMARAATVVRAGTAALRAGCAEVDEAVALLSAGSAPPGPPGTWRDELGDGVGADPQLFRGILARYATDLVLADPTLIDVAQDLVVQAEAAWAARDDRGRISALWGAEGASIGPGPSASTLAAHLSGALTLASAARLERAGLI